MEERRGLKGKMGRLVRRPRIGTGAEDTRPRGGVVKRRVPYTRKEETMLSEEDQE